MKKIHVINIEPDGTKVALKTLNANQFEEYTLIKLEKYINDKEYFTGGESIVLDDQTEKNMIIFYAKKNHKINWFIDYEKIKLKNYFTASNRNEIFFNAVGGYGSASGFEWLEIISKIIKVIFFILKNLYKILRVLSYKKMEKYTSRSKEFIVDVIKSSEKWSCGFITSENFKFKKIVEYFIMKDLGYKRKKGFWIESCK